MRTIVCGGMPVHVFLPEKQAKCKIWANMGQEEAGRAFALAGQEIALFAADGMNWNADLSPWPAKACFRGGEDFAGDAPGRLERLRGAIDEAEAVLPGAQDVPRAIMGYSLAGLFALWAAAQEEAFAACASVSGSLWYDGFDAFLQEHAACFAGKSVYLSLGADEPKTRNVRLKCIGEKTEQAHALLLAAGARCVFEYNRGNHFQESDRRCARAIKWLAGTV